MPLSFAAKTSKIRTGSLVLAIDVRASEGSLIFGDHDFAQTTAHLGLGWNGTMHRVLHGAKVVEQLGLTAGNEKMNNADAEGSEPKHRTSS